MTPLTRPLRCALVAIAWLAVVSAVAPIDAQSQASVGSLLQPNAAPRESWPALAALEQDLLTLERRPDAEIARAWLDIARSALARARALHAQGHAAAAQRSSEITTAAIAAASHTFARHQAEAELAATQRRKEAVIAAAEAARSALTHAQTQRGQIGEAP